MVWISFILILGRLWANELPALLTKHSSETLRYISMDGRYAYVQKNLGSLVLSVVFVVSILSLITKTMTFLSLLHLIKVDS